MCVHIWVCNTDWGINFKNKNYKCAKILIWTKLLDRNSTSNSQTWCTSWSLGIPSSEPSVMLALCPRTRSYASLTWYRWHQNEGLRGQIVEWAMTPPDQDPWWLPLLERQTCVNSVHPMLPKSSFKKIQCAIMLNTVLKFLPKCGKLNISA